MSNLAHNYQPAIKEAVKFWLHSEGNKFDFCVAAAGIVGSYDEGATIELASQIERSVSSVQNYARVGRLWNAMSPQKAEDYRDAVQYSFWALLAPLWDNKVIDMTGVYHWLDEKIANKWTVEKMRSLLPTNDGKSLWKKSAKRFLKTTAEFMDAELIYSPAFDVDFEQYKKTVRALRLARGRITKCIGDE